MRKWMKQWLWMMSLNVLVATGAWAGCIEKYQARVGELQGDALESSVLSAGLGVAMALGPVPQTLQVLLFMARSAHSVDQADKMLDLDDAKSVLQALKSAKNPHEQEKLAMDHLFDIASDGSPSLDRGEFERLIAKLDDDEAFCSEGRLMDFKGVLHKAGVSSNVTDKRFGIFGEYLSRYQAYEAEKEFANAGSAR